MNILGGFKKTGISPFNPSAVDDRMLAPAKVFKPTNDDSSSYTRNTSFSTEQHSLFEKRFNEEYDVQDPLYELWLKEQHPESDTDSMKTHANSLSTMSSNESSVLSEVLKYPEVKVLAKRKGKPAANSTSSVCLSDSPAMKQLKQKEEEKRLAEEEKARKKEEREVKKAEHERKKVLREKEREEKKKEREEKKKERDRKRLAKRTNENSKSQCIRR